MALFGGRLFPGGHRRAVFCIRENGHELSMDVKTVRREADVSFAARQSESWDRSPLFPTFDETCRFFQKGDCGFSCSLENGKLEAVRLRTLRWEMSPLKVERVHAAFYQSCGCFPPGSVVFDSAVIMRRIPHEWDMAPALS